MIHHRYHHRRRPFVMESVVRTLLYISVYMYMYIYIYPFRLFHSQLII